jgi:hypothetical protein
MPFTVTDPSFPGTSRTLAIAVFRRPTAAMYLSSAIW